MARCPGHRCTRRRERAIGLALALPLGVMLPACGKSSTPAPAAPRQQAPAEPAPPAAPIAEPPASVTPPAEPPAPAAAPAAEGESAAVAPVRAGPPRLEFATVRHDFGKIIDAGKYSAKFPFKNTGTGTLVIGSLKTDCTCTTTGLPKKEFLPGEGSEIEVGFNPLKPGEQERHVRVFSNAVPNMVILTLAADVETLIQFEGSPVVQFGTLKLGEEHTQTFSVTYTERDLVVEDVTCDNPYVVARVVGIGQPVPDVGYRATVEVTVLPTAPWGLLYPVKLSFAARCPGKDGQRALEKAYTMFVSAELFNDLRARGTIFTGPEQPGAVFTIGDSLTEGQLYQAAVVLERLSGAPFAVSSAAVESSSLPGMTIAVEPVTPSSYRLTLTGETKGAHGGFGGIVKVKTDVPGEEDLTFPFSGYIR